MKSVPNPTLLPGLCPASSKWGGDVTNLHKARLLGPRTMTDFLHATLTAPMTDAVQVGEKDLIVRLSEMDLFLESDGPSMASCVFQWIRKRSAKGLGSHQYTICYEERKNIVEFADTAPRKGLSSRYLRAEASSREVW